MGTWTHEGHRGATRTYLDDAHGGGEALRADGRDDQVPFLQSIGGWIDGCGAGVSVGTLMSGVGGSRVGPGLGGLDVGVR